MANLLHVFQIVELGHREFCLEMSGQGPRLRRDHKFYAQVQGEMALMSCSWYDIVGWTAANRSNCYIERIFFDEVFVSNMLPKLVEFSFYIFYKTKDDMRGSCNHQDFVSFLKNKLYIDSSF